MKNNYLALKIKYQFSSQYERFFYMSYIKIKKKNFRMKKIKTRK